MKRLELDFTGRGRRSAWAARLLLAAALGLSVDAALSYRELRGALELNQAKIAKAQPRGVPARKVASEELAAARETVERLGMPWARLLGALEAAASEEVALLAIEPDAAAGTVLISGDSKNYLAVLNYVMDLGRAEALHGVQLVRHEVKADDPKAPVSFAVSAAWTGGKP